MTHEQLQLRNRLQQLIQEAQPKLTFVKLVNCGDIVELANPENYIKHEQVRKSYFGNHDTWTEVWYDGITLTIEETYRMNHGRTEPNKSFYLKVVQWGQHSGYQLFRVKVSQNDSDKKIQRLVNQAVEAYNTEVAR